MQQEVNKPSSPPKQRQVHDEGKILQMLLFQMNILLPSAGVVEGNHISQKEV